MVLRLIRALPGERRFLSPLPRQHRPAWIDATVAAPGPHDFAVRCGRFAGHAFTHLTPQRPSQPAPTSVTIARRPLLRARAGFKIVLVCGNVNSNFRKAALPPSAVVGRATSHPQARNATVGLDLFSYTT